jgi:energy-coupling factor transport system ATP-binding protein
MNIQLDNVSFQYTSKAFPPHPVFTHLSLSAPSGECVALTGEEGSGKSTLLQLINGLQKPDEGRVLVDGLDLWQRPQSQHAHRRQCGFAFQFPERQFFCQTVEDELMFAVRNFRLPVQEPRERCAAALKELGLPEEFLGRSPFSLSMGEARRVALASLLVHEPRLFLLDEPTAGLDGFGLDVVQSLLLRLKSQGKTILFVAHDADFIAAVASRLVVISKGQVERDIRGTEMLTAIPSA